MTSNARFFLLLSLLLAIAASSWSQQTQQRGPFKLNIAPENISIPQGSQRTFFMQRVSLRGFPHGGLFSAPTWQSSNPAVATINASGLLTAVGTGTATITATSGPYHSSTTVTVTPVALVAIQVTPANTSIATAAQQQFTATGVLSDSTTVDLTAQASWTSSVPGVASITASGGLATGAAVGSTTISASFSGLKGKTGLNIGLITISVDPASASIGSGKLQPFTATGTFTDASKHNVTDSVSWSSSDLTVATVTTLGVAIGMNAGGPVTIQAAATGATAGTASLTVTAPPVLTSVIVSPNIQQLTLGSTLPFSAVGQFSDGSTKAIANPSWFTSNSDIVSVDANGLASALSPGTANIIAIAAAGAQFVSGSAQVTVVSPPTLASIQVTPGSITLNGAASQQFTATGTFSDSSTRDLTTQVTWTSSNLNVAVIGPTGLATNEGIGTSTITADLNGIFGTATLTTTGSLQFVLVNDADRIMSYIVDNATGELIPNGYAYQGYPPYRGTTDPFGRFYYNASYTSNLIFMYKIDHSTGRLLPTNPPFVMTQGDSPLTIAVDPTGHFAYTANQDPGNATAHVTDGFSIDQNTGVLTSIGTFPSGNDPISLEITGNFLYIADGFGFVYAYTIGANGALTAIQGSPFAAGALLSSVKADPSGHFLYAADQSNSQAYSFSINQANGALSAIGTPQPTGVNPFAAAMDPLGRFYYTADISDGTVAGFKIAADGTLSPIAGSPITVFPNGGSPSDVAVDPSGRYLVAVDSNDFLTATFAIDPAQGTLTPIKSYYSRLPFSLALVSGSIPVSPRPMFLYTANRNSANISGFSVNPATGELTPLPQVTFPAIQLTDSLQTDPYGRFVFVTNAAFVGATAQSYTVDSASGTLTPTNPPTQPAGDDPETNNLAIDPGGYFLFSPAFDENDVWSYTIDQNSGALTLVTQGPFPPVPVGTGPIGAAVEPTGSILLVPNNVDNTLSELLVAPTIGLPSVTGSTPTGAAPFKAVVDPTDQFVYVANSTDKTVSGFTFDPVNGTLTPMPNSPFAAGSAFYAAIDPRGRFLYTANAADNTISSFAIDPASGNLTPTPNPTTAAGATPNSAEVDPSGQFLYAANFGDSTISAFTIDQLTGDLTQIAGPPTSLGPQAAGPKQIGLVRALTAPTSQLVSVNVAPAGLEIATGASQQLTATGNFSDGSMRDFTVPSVWTSSDPTIASVNSFGLVTGVSPGIAVITASVLGVSGSTPITVTGQSLVSLSVTPLNPTLPQNNTLQFKVTGAFSDGTTQDLTQSVIWSTSDGTLATISNTPGNRGVATALQPSGTVTIAANSGITTGTTTLTLHGPVTLQSIAVRPADPSLPANPSLPLGTSTAFTAQGTFSDLTKQDLTTSVVWSSGTPATATITSDGIASTVAPGTTQITATSGLVSGSTLLTVLPHTLVSLAITPQNAYVSVNRTLQFSATGTFSDGTSSDLTTQVNWASSNTNVVTIGANTGLATGKAFGPINITASMGGVSTSTRLTGVF